MKVLSLPLFIVFLSLFIVLFDSMVYVQIIVPTAILILNGIVLTFVLPYYTLTKAVTIFFKLHKILPILYIMRSFLHYKIDEYIGIVIVPYTLYCGLLLFASLDLIRVVLYEKIKGLLSEAVYKTSNIKLIEFNYYTSKILGNGEYGDNYYTGLYLFTYKICDPYVDKQKRVFFKLCDEFKKNVPEPFSPDTLFDLWASSPSDTPQAEGSPMVIEVNFLENINDKDKKKYKSREKFNKQKMETVYKKSEKYIIDKFSDKGVSIDSSIDRIKPETFNEEYSTDKMSITESSLINLYGIYGKNLFNYISFHEDTPINYNRFEANLRQINIERKNLYGTLLSQKSMISILNAVFLSIEFAIIALASFYILEIDFVAIALPAPFLAWSICPSIVALIYAFAHLVFTHPYDCGDRVTIEGENLIVNKINFFSTEFNRWDGCRVILYNHKVLKHPISNSKRSIRQSDIIKISLSSNTSKYKLENLVNRINKAAESNNFFFSITVTIDRIVDSNLLNIIIYLKHNSNFQIAYFMWKRRTAFMYVVKEILHDMKIEWLPLTENYEVIK